MFTRSDDRWSKKKCEATYGWVLCGVVASLFILQRDSQNSFADFLSGVFSGKQNVQSERLVVAHNVPWPGARLVFLTIFLFAKPDFKYPLICLTKQNDQMVPDLCWLEVLDYPFSWVSRFGKSGTIIKV